MKNPSILIYVYLILLISCGEEKKKQDIKDSIKIVQVEEPKVNIKNLAYSSLWNGVKAENEYEDVYATYTSNRLGQLKKAISLDGITEYVEIDNHDNINPIDEITISLWYKPISFRGSGNDPLIIKLSDNTERQPFVQYMFSVTGNEYSQSKGLFQFALALNNTYYTLKTKTNIWTPDQWYNLTGSYDGKTIKFYLNGILQNSKNIEGKLTIFNTNLFVGKKGSDSKFYTPGSFDNLRIYNRALTGEEVKRISEIL